MNDFWFSIICLLIWTALYLPLMLWARSKDRHTQQASLEEDAFWAYWDDGLEFDSTNRMVDEQDAVEWAEDYPEDIVFVAKPSEAWS